MSLETLLRLCVGFVLLLPTLEFVTVYLCINGTFDGIGEEFVAASAYSASDWLSDMQVCPGRTVLYGAVVAALGRFAFGRRS